MEINNKNINMVSKNNELEQNKANENSLLWIYDPYILFNRDKLLDIYPKESMTREEKINSVTRIILYITIFSLLIFRDAKILLTSIITIIFLLLTYFLLNNKDKNLLLNGLKEGFSDKYFYEKNKDNYSNPEKNNPIMNVLLPEIQDNPDRKKAAPSYNEEVVKEINTKTQEFIQDNFQDKNIDKKLFNDLGDKFMFDKSMRQFYSTASTTIPNNQKEFAEFCYGNMASCKDGEIDCNTMQSNN